MPNRLPRFTVFFRECQTTHIYKRVTENNSRSKLRSHAVSMCACRPVVLCFVSDLLPTWAKTLCRWRNQQNGRVKANEYSRRHRLYIYFTYVEAFRLVTRVAISYFLVCFNRELKKKKKLLTISVSHWALIAACLVWSWFKSYINAATLYLLVFLYVLQYKMLLYCIRRFPRKRFLERKLANMKHLQCLSPLEIFIGYSIKLIVVI